MANPNMPNMLQQNIVLNQVPLSHALMTNVNANNGIPIATTLPHATSAVDQVGEMKTGIMVETIPIAAGNLVGIPNVPSVQTASPHKIMHQQQQQHQHHQQSGSNNVDSLCQILTKARLNDLVRDTDPTLILEEDVEEALLAYTDDFLNRVLNGAAMIAKHRHVNTIEVKDVQQFLNRNYGIWAPGFGTDELRPYKRSMVAESHKQRLALIRKALKKY